MKNSGPLVQPAAVGSKDSGSAGIVRLTESEWLAQGRLRFGDDTGAWKFVCPVCGNVQAVNDFKPFQDRGATPDSAVSECVGRYLGAKDFQPKGAGPCNYAGYGLLRLSPVRVIRADGHETHAFAFAAPSNSSSAQPSDGPTNTEGK